MIEKIANNKTNQEEINLHPIKDIQEKLNYYRSLFGKIQDLPDEEFELLKQDIAKFFNLKIGGETLKPHNRLVRISVNNRILAGQGKELSYLTDISQLLAPPIEYCGFGRCNIPKQQVIYCANSEACAYWEIKPQKGDVITISHFELKPDAKLKCLIVKPEKTKDPVARNQLEEVYFLLEDFFVDVYSLAVSRNRPKDYLFSGLLSSELLFYPVVSDQNFEAIIYPSVQKKKFGENIAIRNELILERYNLIAVETRFILDEYTDLDHTSDEVTTDQIIGSFYTTKFDLAKGKILYDEKSAGEMFELFRKLQTAPNPQVRFEHEGLPKNLPFNLSAKTEAKSIVRNQTLGRNQKINVVYQNGTRVDQIKYKKVEQDIHAGKCRIAPF